MQKSEKNIFSRRHLLQAGVALALTPVAAKAAEEKAPQWCMVIDLNRCIGCQSCTLACKGVDDIPEKQKTRMHVSEDTEKRVRFSPIMCFQCNEPDCMKVCSSNALYKEEGVVRVNTKLCTGCEACEKACSYEGIFLDKRSQKAAKCEFCRPASSDVPACVQACAAKARIFGDLRKPHPLLAKALQQNPKTLAKSTEGGGQVLYIPLKHKEKTL